MFCGYCNTDNSGDSRFCRICGNRLDSTEVVPKSQLVTPIQALPGIPGSDMQVVSGDIARVQEMASPSGVPMVQGAASGVANVAPSTRPEHTYHPHHHHEHHLHHPGMNRALSQ